MSEKLRLRRYLLFETPLISISSWTCALARFRRTKPKFGFRFEKPSPPILSENALEFPDLANLRTSVTRSITR